MEHADHLPTTRAAAGVLRFTDVSLPAAWSSRRTLQDIKAYGALLEEYRRFLVAVRHFSVELDKLHNLPAYTHAERLAVQVRIARHEQELADMQEEAEITRLERALKKARLRRQIAEHTERAAPTSTTANTLAEMQAITQSLIAAAKACGVSEESPLLAAVRAQLFETIIRKLT
jgi:hypothetical protein